MLIFGQHSHRISLVHSHTYTDDKRQQNNSTFDVSGFLFAHVFTFLHRIPEYRRISIFSTHSHSLSLILRNAFVQLPSIVDSLWELKINPCWNQIVSRQYGPELHLKMQIYSKNLSSVCIWCDNKHRYYCHTAYFVVLCAIILIAAVAAFAVASALLSLPPPTLYFHHDAIMCFSAIFHWT